MCHATSVSMVSQHNQISGTLGTYSKQLFEENTGFNTVSVAAGSIAKCGNLQFVKKDSTPHVGHSNASHYDESADHEPF